MLHSVRSQLTEPASLVVDLGRTILVFEITLFLHTKSVFCGVDLFPLCKEVR